MPENRNFLLERRLRDLDPVLHRKYKDCVVVMSVALDRYLNNFPYFTDHSMRHVLDVLEFCNKIVGDNLSLLNAQEIYVLLMGIYLHDFGMAISEHDYHELMRQINEAEYLACRSRAEIANAIRSYHHELSAALIRKYAPLFELEDESYIHAISQVARGHRVTDLTDESEYPAEYRLSGGQTVCLPYLAALVRLADELDIASGRNSVTKYDYPADFPPHQIRQFEQAKGIRSVRTTAGTFYAEITATGVAYEDIMKNAVKIRQTIGDCRLAVNGRTRFTITQRELVFVRPEESTGDKKERA